MKAFRRAVLVTLGVSAALNGFCADPNSFSYAPAILPGKGLAQHDFIYSGEAKDERLFIVRGGRIVWSYIHPGWGEISDALLEPNGHILFAHQFGITEITLDKKVVWHYDAPTNTEIHTAQPYGANSVCFIQNGVPAKFIVLNKISGVIEHQFTLPAKGSSSVHRQFRRARMTAAGTLLIAHLDLGKVVEYDWNSKPLWSYALSNCWSAELLANGNILAATSGAQLVREINRKGETIWEWTPADAPEYKFSNPQTAIRLPNGNTIINNWFEHLRTTSIRAMRRCRPSKSRPIKKLSGRCARGRRPPTSASPRQFKFSAIHRRKNNYDDEAFKILCLVRIYRDAARGKFAVRRRHQPTSKKVRPAAGRRAHHDPLVVIQFFRRLPGWAARRSGFPRLPVGLTELPARLRQLPPGFSRRLTGRRQLPLRRSQLPAGSRRRPTGFGGSLTGFFQSLTGLFQRLTSFFQLPVG